MSTIRELQLLALEQEEVTLAEEKRLGAEKAKLKVEVPLKGKKKK